MLVTEIGRRSLSDDGDLTLGIRLILANLRQDWKIPDLRALEKIFARGSAIK